MRIDLARKARSKSVRNDEKIDLSGNENKFYIAYKFIRKESKSSNFNSAARSSVWKIFEFPPTPIKLNIDSVVEEPCIENLSSFLYFSTIEK